MAGQSEGSWNPLNLKIDGGFGTSSGGMNFNPGDALRQLSANAGQGINAVSNNFTQGANAFNSNLNSGKGNAANNWNGIAAGLGNGANYDPSKGTTGALMQGFTNGGDFSNGWNQMQGGWNNQAQPVWDRVQDNAKAVAGGSTAGLLVGSVLGDPGLGAAAGAIYGGGNQMANSANQFNQQQSNAAAQRKANDQLPIQQQQQAEAQNAAQAQQDQQTGANQAAFNQANGLEDAYRAAQLMRQGNKANANNYGY